MEGRSRNEENKHHQLLDLIPKERKSYMKRGQETSHIVTNSEEKKLELRLGPPNDERDDTVFSYGYVSYKASTTSNLCRIKPNFNKRQVEFFSSFLQLQSSSVDLQSAEKKAFSPAVSAATAVPANSAQKRTAPVVGWPPIRSFRKNFVSSSTIKPVSESQNVVPSKVASQKPIEIGQNGLFVKINMDGIPIGRKVDLNTYDSYEKLSSAIDQLFRGFLTAETDSSAGGNQNKENEAKPITGLLDGSGEYTLVYEDNEGDKMLVGDVPWHMFVSTVKRLRVLKSSDLSKLSRGTKQGKH